MHHMKEEIENRIHPMKKSFIQYLSLRWNLGFIIVLWHQIQNISAVVLCACIYKISSRHINIMRFGSLLSPQLPFAFSSKLMTYLKKKMAN